MWDEFPTLGKPEADNSLCRVSSAHQRSLNSEASTSHSTRVPMLSVPEFAIAYGFVNGPGGTHTSRTMMLRELSLLLDACAADSRYDDYASAIITRSMCC